jgi:hypothetical protein
MFAVWWLAFAGLPVFQQPLPESPGEPAAIAVAAGRAALRTPCYALACKDAEWSGPSRYVRLQRRTSPGTVPQLQPLRMPAIATRTYPLYSPATRRDWHAAYGSESRFDARYGYEAIRTPDTKLKVEMGTGYRLQPYADFGTAVPGPIARGNLALSQSLGERARLTQQVEFETGRENTTLRQTLGVDLELRPQWLLQSSFELRHDTFADDGEGLTDREGSVRLKYRF